MEQSIINEELFRHSFTVAMILGILSRFLVLRVKDKQYPSKPQDYIEQIIIAGLASALGAIAIPALMDKEFAALTFLAVGIQQFQGLSKQEKITLVNLDEEEIVPRGITYIEEISSTYETRSYVSLFAAFISSIIYIYIAKTFFENLLICTVFASVGALIVGLVSRKLLQRHSISDIADIKETKLYFDGPIMKVDNVVISNIGLKDTREKFMKQGVALEVTPKDRKDFGVINDLGQRSAILNTIYIHVGIDRDVDDKDIVTVSKVNLEKESVIVVFMPILKDIDAIKSAAGSTPILETAKGKASQYKKLIKR